jgi:hypothetical protein
VRFDFQRAPEARKIVAPGVSPGRTMLQEIKPAKRATEAFTRPCDSRILSPLRGSGFKSGLVPGLTPGATIFRAYGAH